MRLDGAKVEELRKKALMTQQELAEKVGVHRITIVRLVNEEQQPMISTVGKIAKALGVQMSDLIKD